MTVLGEALRSHAMRQGDQVAIHSGTHGALSWNDLASQVEQLTAEFSAVFDHNRPVAIALDAGLANCVTDLALLEAGIASLPLPPFFTPDQRQHALRAAGAQAMLTPSPDGRDFHIEPLDLPAMPLPAGTAKISFTSGSTGTPKGICLSADHMLAVANAVVSHVGQDHAGRHLALLPPGILLENVAGFYAALLAGGCTIALPQLEVGLANPFAPDWGKVLDAIAQNEATSLILVPELLNGIVRAMDALNVRFPALTLVAVGGARVMPATLDHATALGLPVRQGYGLTECASVVALESAGDALRGSVGQSIGVNSITIAADGEIILNGPLFLGTIGAPRATGPLATGDLGQIDADGRLTILGRKSNLIITSHGRNISPEWVESLLIEHPAIAQAMVHGDGESTLSALIVPASPDADIAAAIDRANGALPGYARVANWRLVPPFMPVNDMLTGNGRLRRDVISQTYLSGKADSSFYARLVNETTTQRALMSSVPQLQAGLTGRISLATYIAYLTQAYHHVCHTVPLMQEARARLAHRPDLIIALDDYIEEETGHEAWILSDITAAGGDGVAAGQSTPAPATKAMVDHAYDVIRTGNPIAFFGMVFVLEGTSVAMATHGADAVRKALNLPKNAFSYLTSHGSLDIEHLRFFENLMGTITDPDDQAAIIQMAKDIFRLFAAMFAAIPMEPIHEAA